MADNIVELPYLERQSTLEDPLYRNSIMAPRMNGDLEIMDGTIFAKQLVVGAQAWIHDLVWTASDYNTVSWSSGTIKLADGSTYTITAGNTGNISGATYIYLDKSVSTTVLQTTTTYSSAISDSKILLAIASPSADTGSKSVVNTFNSEGTTIDGSKITTGKIQSSDTLTYFDLDNDRIVMNDGSTNRIVIGNI